MTTHITTRNELPEVFPPDDAGASEQPSWSSRIVFDVQELWSYRAVIRNLVSQELHVRYHRSLLGFLWTLLNPILMMTVLSMVFSQLFRVTDAPSYALYLFSGMVPWSLLFNTINDSSTCIIANEVLIRKIYVPKLVFPLSKLLLNITMLTLSLGALFLLMVPLGARFTPTLLLLPVAIVLFATFAVGLGLMTAVINTFYRDFGHLVSVLLQGWYFSTPILYSLKDLPPDIAWRFWLNPAYPFIRVFQEIICYGRWPSGVLLLSALTIAVVSLGIGYVTFKSYEDKLVFRL